MKPKTACLRAPLIRRLTMRSLAFIAILAALEMLGGALLGQTPRVGALDEDRIASHYGLDIWQTQQGLPSDAILTMIQTSDGYIWGGTFNGLVRFDGSFFHVFNKANTPALLNNSIIALFEDSRRALWIGVQEGGVVRYKDGVFTRFDEGSGLGSLIARSFCEDADGALLIGTNKGLYRVNNVGVVTERLFNDLPLPDRVNALRRDSAGTLWIGTDAGLIETRGGNFFKRHKHAAGLPRHFVTSLYGSSSSLLDTLWIGTLNGLYILVGGEYQKFPLLDTAVAVRSLYRDRDGALWIGAEQGLYVWRWMRGAFSLKRLGVEDGMSDNMVYSIAQDKEGSLWFGTYYGGFNRLKKQTFRNVGGKRRLFHDGNARR